MVFTSLDYALLLAVTFGLHWTLPGRLAAPLLLLASAVFYAHWSLPFLGLLAACAAAGWAAGLALEASRRAGRSGRAVLGLTAASLLGVLAGFKYAGLLASGWRALAGRPPSVEEVALPLGISFYVFQILGYVADVQRGAAAERSPLRFALFVAFFPQLVAGPIARARELRPPLRARPRFDAVRTLDGLELLAYGVVKKTVFADNLGVHVDRVYGATEIAGGADAALATLAFGAQIYFDFSGYTDIARGSARLLGIELPENFRSPYAAKSLAEFWRRWHVTLSTWLRDYLYVPLGGGRRSAPRVAANLLVTMVLGGLWHGAGTTFVLWGAYHGVLLVAERAVRRRPPPRWPAGLGRPSPGMLGTFLAVQGGWVLFRAGDLATLGQLGAAVAQRPLALHPALDSLAYLPLIALSYGLHGASAWLRERPALLALRVRPAVAAPALLAAVLLVVVFGGSSDAFIYFQF